MAAFKPGNTVAFPLDRRTWRTGTITRREFLGTSRGWLIHADGPNPGPWFAFAKDITAVPAAAVFQRDVKVQVAADSPHYPGRVGCIDEPAVIDGTFGYWLHLTGPAELAWVPAQKLAPALDGGA
ncbi:hypothetical protein [Mycobacterium sp.]|uniref:hypothetical protein n=1 Tax=Mycobacterium sp. TaxID=1785 RepID=UPI0026208AD4|nr:hypothetical protein [Mycobacterium sp.]